MSEWHPLGFYRIAEVGRNAQNKDHLRKLHEMEYVSVK